MASITNSQYANQRPPSPTSAPSRRFSLLLTVGVLALSACASLPTEVQRPASYVLEDTSSTRLAQDIQPLVDAHPDLSGFHVLDDGSDAFAMRMHLIHTAEKSIDAQYFIWHMDLTGKAMYAHLLQAADRGVRVRILLDDLDTGGKDELLQLIDAHPNMEIRLYNPFANRELPAADFITDFDRVDHRMHTKTFTADNRAVVFGGRNVGDEYFAASPELGFRDMDVLAVGPIVQEISSQFDLFWNSEWVYPVSAFPLDKPIATEDVEAFHERVVKDMEAASGSDYAHIVSRLDSTTATSFADLDLFWSEWLLAYDLPSNVEGGELTAATHLAPNLKQGMDRTREELIIVAPYFVPGKEFARYLVEKAEQGVRVRILTNSLASGDVSLVHAAYMRYREDLLAAGVELYEYKAFSDEEIDTTVGPYHIDTRRGMLHAKSYGFDRRYLFVGSFNLDPRSAVWNTELGAYFESPEHARHLSEVFDEQIMLFAYRLQLDADGELEWFTLGEDGREVRVDHEPDTEFWERFNTRILSPLVPEQQM
jgi:putative cardiolipin synthase